MKINQFLKINAVAIAAVMFTGATMSFKIIEKKAADQQFYYNSTDTSAGAFSQESNWAVGAGSSCLTTGNKPCTITVPEGQDLVDVIGGMTNSQVLAIHPSERRQ
ncbi:hypothetical protein [Epilithonimonas sp. UC225_85]|jgi:nucleoside-specific outer membrane channel protein Tsx|uniref:hypothetical protein n=1 Tax=Epilithonimonas sp. UC225_85 TaxID=3350167 RepID=UPI0036D28896